jgi:hypothetical protein
MGSPISAHPLIDTNRRLHVLTGVDERYRDYYVNQRWMRPEALVFYGQVITVDA